MIIPCAKTDIPDACTIMIRWHCSSKSRGIPFCFTLPFMYRISCDYQSVQCSVSLTQPHGQFDKVSVTHYIIILHCPCPCPSPCTSPCLCTQRSGQWQRSYPAFTDRGSSRGRGVITPAGEAAGAGEVSHLQG